MNNPNRVREWLARWEAADDDLPLLVDKGGQVTIGDLRELAKQGEEAVAHWAGIPPAYRIEPPKD